MAKSVEYFTSRIEVVKAAVSRPWATFLIAIFALIGFWDTVADQLLPPETSKQAPTVYEVVLAMSGWLPFWAWVCIGAILIALITIEYAFRLNKAVKSKKNNVANEKLSSEELDDWRKVDPLELWRAGCLWKGYRPHTPIPFSDPAYASYIRLVNAAKGGRLSIVEPSGEVGEWSLVDRAELERFAHDQGEAPDFLERANNETALQDIPIRRDVWLLDAIHFVASGSWQRYEWDDLGGKMGTLLGAMNKLTQAASDSEVPIWGKEGFSGLHIEIQPSEWRNYRMDEMSLFKGDPDQFCARRTNHRSIPANYSALMTSRAKVEEWRAANI